VFPNLMTGDVINRVCPATQSALLEVREERSVTADGVSRRVPRPFFVIATQNPPYFQGTFPLPDVQLDRFAMRLSLGYADPDTERAILDSWSRHRASDEAEPVTDTDELDDVIDEIDQISVAHLVQDYIVQLADATRRHPDLRLGVSTRGTLSLMRVARAYAATEERDFVTPDDVKTLINPVFAHRIALTPEAELRGQSVDSLLADIADTVPVPRASGG